MRKRMPAIFIIAIIFITFVGISSLFIPNKNKYEKEHDDFSMGKSKMVNAPEKDSSQSSEDKEDNRLSKAVSKEGLDTYNKPEANEADEADEAKESTFVITDGNITDNEAADLQTLNENESSTEQNKDNFKEEIILDKKENNENQEKEKYILRLKNIEAYYAAIWKDACPPDMAGMKELENEEYTKWDTELNLIYQKIKAEFSEEDFLEVRDAEREWIKERDEKAAKAASEFAGSTMESLEYMGVMTELTRQRTYELVDIYFEYICKHS